MAGPLQGIRILDLTSVVMGPFATQILAELGAEVIKIEPHEGDNMRHVGPLRHAGMGHLCINLNRGKRCIVLDLKKPDALEAMMRLVRSADVLVYNVRPSAMARLKLSYDEVSAANPRLLYVGCYGYSERGPYAGRAAYDDLIQGATGLPWMISEGGKETPRYVPINLADRITGLHVVYAVSAALFARERAGKGQAVEVPMFESIAHFVLGDHLAGLSWQPAIGPTGYPRLMHRRPYATRDGYLCVLVYNDKQWKSFLEAVGRTDLWEDARFNTHGMRAQHIDEVYDVLAEIMKTRTSAQWMELLARADIPFSRMNSPEDVVADRHLNESGFFVAEDHPSEGRLRAMRTPTHWSLSEPDMPTPAPRLGEHSRALLREIGYSDAEIEGMAASGATLLG
ncbi:MAG TPA: CoA transferase [Burkholderiales bacterium]|nr:CoA transferase [Burkholderiales bacterium]